ncbi:MAG TPA: Gfo/Idh/MocA family oxidoreductase [Burkholderiales bacterium]|nr:Gfo/Idh/MocA family oxidoreductase [Burkholderiales bacterium]
MVKRDRLGIAVIGCGRIGTLRATMAAAHSAVAFVAVADQDPVRAKMLADKVGAQFHTSNNLEAMSRPEVNAIVVSTIEMAHTEPVLQALGLGKAVLVEKPIAVDLHTADRILAAAAKSKSSLHVGYSRRFKERYLIAKEQIVQGRLGRITGTAARVYNSRSQAMQTLARMPAESNPVSGLTYYIDLLNWLLAGNEVVEVVARGQRGVISESGHNAPDVVGVLLTYADGAISTLGVSYALPAKYPSLGHAARVEVVGREGVMLLDDDHTDQLMYSERGADHVYIPGHRANMVFLGSGTPGDWALGEFQGPVATETRAWLDHLSMGKPCHLATAHEARKVVEITLAIERSLRTRQAVELPLAQE